MELSKKVKLMSNNFLFFAVISVKIQHIIIHLS